MKEVQDALLRLVSAGMKTKKLQESYLNNGLDDNDLFQIYGEIADAISILIGEREETFEETRAFMALTVPGLDDEHRVRYLMNGYRQNHPEQPKPQFPDREQMRRNVGKGLGYLFETPEGDWS